MTRPTLFDYAVTRCERQGLADRVYATVAHGAIQLEAGRSFAVAHAAEAHRAPAPGIEIFVPPQFTFAGGAGWP